MGHTDRRTPGTVSRAKPAYRVRAAAADATPPGVHLADPRGGRSSAHGRPRGGASSVLRYAVTALAVFALALLLVTGVEVVVGHPLSGDVPGHTSLGDVLHPTTLTTGP